MQLYYYLKGTKYEVGFLVNFGSEKIEIKRRIQDKSVKSVIKEIREDFQLYALLNKLLKDRGVDFRQYRPKCITRRFSY